jgi:hypothetical protein
MTPRMFTAAEGPPFRVRFHREPTGAAASVVLRFVGSESSYRREKPAEAVKD